MRTKTNNKQWSAYILFYKKIKRRPVTIFSQIIQYDKKNKKKKYFCFVVQIKFLKKKCDIFFVASRLGVSVIKNRDVASVLETFRKGKKRLYYHYCIKNLILNRSNLNWNEKAPMFNWDPVSDQGANFIFLSKKLTFVLASGLDKV